MTQHHVPLQPLRIPGGWTVLFNDLRHLEPASLSPLAVNDWQNYREDLLQLVHNQCHVLIDLGWYPEFQPIGMFRGVVVRHYSDEDQMIESWETPLVCVESRSQIDVVAVIETWLQDYRTTLDRD